jgi:hypothetical protein
MYSGLQEVAPYWCRITRHLLYKGEISHGTVLNNYEAMNRNKYLDNWYSIPERDWEEALRCFGIEIS